MVAASASQPAAASGVEVRLIALSPRPEPRSSARPDTIALDYLVAVRASDPFAEHHLAGEVAFALMANPDIEILDRSAADACRTLAAPPASGLVVRALLSRVRRVERAPLVRLPLKARLTGLSAVPSASAVPKPPPEV